jgi:HEAT repeat protein
MKKIALACLCLALGWAGAAHGQGGGKKDPFAPDGLKSLKNPDPAVRFNSACVLLELGPVAKFAIPALHEALQDKVPRVRVKVAEALWRIERPPVRVLLPVLLDGLKEKEVPVRINALAVLGRMGSGAKAAAPEIIKALQDKDEDVRLEAVLALGEMGSAAKSAIPALLAVLKSDELRLLEPAVSVTLGNIGSSAVSALKKALADKDVRLRRTGAFALGLIGPKAKSATAELSAALADREPDVRALAARALGRVGSAAQSALPKLEAALKDKEVPVRVNAALALWQAGGRTDGLPVLKEALADKRPHIREQACAALGALGEKAAPAAPALFLVLADKDARVRSACAEALGKLPPGKAVRDKLTAALADKDDLVRLSVAGALWGQSGGAERGKLVELAAGALESKSAPVRKRAAEVLGRFGPAAKEAVPALLLVLRDRQNAVREAAAAALRQIDPKAAARAGVRGP